MSNDKDSGRATPEDRAATRAGHGDAAPASAAHDPTVGPSQPAPRGAHAGRAAADRRSDRDGRGHYAYDRDEDGVRKGERHDPKVDVDEPGRGGLPPVAADRPERQGVDARNRFDAEGPGEQDDQQGPRGPADDDSRKPSVAGAGKG